jgi:hypothetical protein
MKLLSQISAGIPLVQDVGGFNEGRHSIFLLTFAPDLCAVQVIEKAGAKWGRQILEFCEGCFDTLSDDGIAVASLA